MKRLSGKALKMKSQKGVSIIDALFAMVIASMIAAAVTTSLGTWFNVRNTSANQDAANQYAQGILAKTNALDWDKLGFDSTTPSIIEPDSSLPECPVAFRTTAQVGEKTLKTVLLNGQGNPAGLEQTAVAELRGKKYCVLTDVTWNNAAASGNEMSSSSATKNVSVTVSWMDNNNVRSISVNSTRSPSIGEAIPSGISEGRDAETSPIKFFSITKAQHDGVNGLVCYRADWNDTSDVVSAVGSAGIGLSPVSVSTALSGEARNAEQCFTAGESPAYSFYGLTVGDEAGVKFVGGAEYQFPGSKLSAEGRTLSWTKYSSTGTTKYKVMKSNNGDFSDPELLIETTDSNYEVPESEGAVWVRVDTENSDYSVPANSNVVEIAGVEGE
jgi:type II secretory pathway pseudopilin PulG